MLAQDDALRLPAVERPYELREVLRYGTNPHHACVRLAPVGAGDPYRLADGGARPLSATNVLDLDLGVRLLAPFEDRAGVALVKHVTPTGVALARTGLEAWHAASVADPGATHGTLVTTAVVDRDLALAVAAGRPVHVVGAAGFTAAARHALLREDVVRRMRGLRLVELDFAPGRRVDQVQATSLADGSLLVEHHRSAPIERAGVVNAHPCDLVWRAAVLANHVALHSRTIAAVVARGRSVVSVAAGHQNALRAVEAALTKLPRVARHAREPLVLASDGHFSLLDPIPLLAGADIPYLVIGGTVDDADIIARGAAHGVHVTLTNRRSFRH